MDVERLALRLRKLKTLAAWADEGGSWMATLAAAVQLLEQAGTASWRAEADRLRRRVAILLLVLNTAPRAGDVGRWRIGEDLRRGRDGGWRLAYRSGKTDQPILFTSLWAETDRALDLLLLAGRPEEQIDQRLAALHGRNWITHSPGAVSATYVSEQVRALIGLSAHPIRTLAADALRSLDPATAADRAAVWLGHRDPRTQAKYAALAQGRLASERWTEARSQIGSG